MTKEAAKTTKKWINDADAILVTASNVYLFLKD